MTGLPRLDAVVFDMDGLLLDTERLQQRAYERACARMALVADPHLFMALVGLNERMSEALLDKALPRDLDVARFKSLWAAEFAASVADHVPLKPGVIHLLDALRVRGLPMAVATSTKRSKAVALLQRAGILDRFALLVCGDEVARGKPAPDVYLAAVGGLGHQPGACVAFEDSSNGVRAAVSAGLVTVQVPDLIPPPAEIVALGHVIAPDLLTGAQRVGCL